MIYGLEHPRIVKFYGITVHPVGFVMEWAAMGSLDDIIKQYQSQRQYICPNSVFAVTLQVKVQLYIMSHVTKVLILHRPSADYSTCIRITLYTLISSHKIFLYLIFHVKVTVAIRRITQGMSQASSVFTVINLANWMVW